MEPDVSSRPVSRIPSVAVGQQDCAVVQFDAGEARSWLIAAGFTLRPDCRGMVLNEVTWLTVDETGVQTADFKEVVLDQSRDGRWFALNTADMAPIPGRSRTPCPVVFISAHGYAWMLQMIRSGGALRVVKHLESRFTADCIQSGAARTLPGPPPGHGPYGR